MQAKNILVPIDFSEHSRHALRTARDLCAENGGSLTLLHVGHMPYGATDPYLHTAGGELLISLSTRVSAIQMKRLEEWAAEELPDVMSPELVVREGPPWAEIVDQITEGGHDLVVMGTHGRTGLAHAWLGSVTERVLQRSPVPVLVVK